MHIQYAVCSECGAADIAPCLVATQPMPRRWNVVCHNLLFMLTAGSQAALHLLCRFAFGTAKGVAGWAFNQTFQNREPPFFFVGIKTCDAACL
jgi:hypothetical protein